MWKKIISMIAVVSMMCATVSASQFTLESTVESGTADIVINCGSDMADKMITVTVFEPESGFDALSGDGGNTYTVTDSQTVNDAISMVCQQKADSDGKVKITYKPKGVRGKYYVRVSGENLYDSQMLSFDFVAPNEAKEIVDALADNPTTSEIANIFKKSDNENVYASYQLVGLHNSQFFADFDAADDKIKTAVYNYISKKLTPGITVEEFNNLFTEAAFVELVNGLEADTLAAFIEKAESYSGLSETKIYTDIKNSETYYTDSVKNAFVQTVQKTNLSGADKNTVKDTVAQLLFITLVTECDSYGVLKDVIVDFADEIETAGGNISGFDSSSTQLNIARKLMDKRPFSDMKDFVEKLNVAIKEEKGSSGGGSVQGSGSGKTSSGGSYSSGATSAVYSTDVSQKTPASQNTSSALAADFADLGGVDWAKDAIVSLKSAGIINGRTETEFAPDECVTRAEFVKMLVLALNMDIADTAEISFADVTEDDWYCKYIKTAVAAGIVTGYGDTFGADDPISRQDMVTMTYRAIANLGKTLEITRGNHSFTDAISDYAAEAIEKLYGAELVNGRTDTEFAANDYTTRAEAAKFLHGVFVKFATR